MTRRQAVGLMLAFLLICGGRWVRHALLVGPDGRFRASLPGDALLPPIADAPESAPPPPPEGPFDVNRVSADTLCCLSGVGPVLARRIVEERMKAPFRDAEDLQRVKGIGQAMAARIAPDLIFDDPPEGASSSLKVP